MVTNLKMENAYKYFDLTYNELRYTPFSMEDKKYWQFYKQRKEELNPKKKTKSKIRNLHTTSKPPSWSYEMFVL